MCGIFGIIGNKISKEYLKSDELMLSLNHRGPDFNNHIFKLYIIFIIKFCYFLTSMSYLELSLLAGI